jgi:hypothetical protein
MYALKHEFEKSELECFKREILLSYLTVGFIKINRRLPSPHNVQSGLKFFQIDDFAELADLQSP